jgi:hypothetical protein
MLFSAQTTRQVNVARHDRDAFGVDGGQVGVLKEADEIRFRGFLERHDGGGLEAEVCLCIHNIGNAHQQRTRC